MLPAGRAPGWHDREVTDFVDLRDVRAARELLDGVVRQTPLEPFRPLADTYLKCENLQRGGFYKVRGAYTRISRLSPAERAAGVVAREMEARLDEEWTEHLGAERMAELHEALGSLREITDPFAGTRAD